ncbi:histidine kinase [Microbacterium betulae]|uniref:histidine kinase n=1 Tax=Microbacterium betulae TaxID=2981139 RepID=A0AA97FHZ7_9MICO|nr:histidine kinase [Microbacterium sp. AB]WOF23028.1 histidine kinase [Microbacterium sp. AB]
MNAVTASLGPVENDAGSDLLERTVTRQDLRRDAVLGAALFGAAVISIALASVSGAFLTRPENAGWSLLASAFMTLPLGLRRRLPVTVTVVVCGAYFVAVSLQFPELYVSQVAIFIAIFTIGAWLDDRRRAAMARVLITAAMFLWLLVTTFVGATDTEALEESFAGALSPYLAYMLLIWLVNAAYFGGAYYMGDRAYTAARTKAILQRRTRELEEERERTAAQAVALDRVRIARELHDVVAHHVSAMGVQAGAARTVIDGDPEAARSALAVVEDSARSAIAELHHLLDTLRTADGDPDFSAGAPSTLRLESLRSLAEAMTASGTPTNHVVVGEPVPVPDLVQVNLYRVAQEALTNARRHGGPDATAEVRVRYTDESVELEVTNAGRIALDARPGLGQLGMRERAIASGGTLELRARDRGGYLVRVTVPLTSDRRVTAAA